MQNSLLPMFCQWFSRGKSSLGLTIICICSLFCSYSLLACSILTIASEGTASPAPVPVAPSVEDFAREADVIVIGTVIAEEDDATTEVVDVQYYLKGSGPQEIRIAGFQGVCESWTISLGKGAKAIFFATGHPSSTMKRVRPLSEWWGGQHFEANDQESIKKILSMTGQGLTKPSSANTYWLWGTGAVVFVLVVFLFLWKRRLQRIRSYKSQDEISN